MRRPPTLVVASAGSGKTHRLTGEVTASISPDAVDPVRLEGLVAVTYTRKAQAELAARIRRSLIEAGGFDDAARLPVAYVGTVHSVSMRLVEEFAIDAGLSPFLEVLPDDGGRRLRAAIETAVDGATLARIDRLSRRLDIGLDSRILRHDWIRRVAEIMDLARGNRIAPDALPAMAARSADGLLALLPAPADDADVETLDANFDRELELAIERISAGGDSTKVTADATARLGDIARRRHQGDVRWCDWAWASQVGTRVGVRSRQAVAMVGIAAAAYPRHPGFHADLRAFLTTLYDVARTALDGFSAFKADRRLVDYLDMIDRALTLTEDPDVAGELAARLELIVVDEFQDTSPLQLALFMRLHALSRRSVWVGDSKQCIFEYAGADPALMDAVATWVDRHGGATETLGRNFRSRPELVRAYGALFAGSFADVAAQPVRVDPPGLDGTPPFGVWWLQAPSAAGDAGAIADGVARLLAEPASSPIVDATTGEVRGVRPRDVGILVATNDEARRIAAELQRRGLRASLPRDGLMGTPEGVMLEAALRWLLAPGDRGALATLEALGEWNGVGPDAWLAGKLVGTAEPPAWLAPLEALRARVRSLSPTELVDRAIHALDLPTWCARWPDPRQRLGNLDALRALAARYEERCARARDVATAAGLVRYFDEARRTVTTRDGERAMDDQFVDDDGDAITLCTYHRAKGLEWPVIVLASLGRRERRNAFDPCPESDVADLDPDAPLRGRWIRYWPWPFGQLQNLPLADAAESSAEGRRVAERERRERRRLLYVGFTRARDHLVLAVGMGARGARTAWLDELRAPDGSAALVLPTEASDGAVASIIAGGERFACRVWRLHGDVRDDHAPAAAVRFARAVPPCPDRPAFRITPSQAAGDAAVGRRLRVRRVREIGAGLPMRRDSNWEAIGHVVHGFLAADPGAGEPLARGAMARRLLAGHDVAAMISTTALIAMADRLSDTVAKHWPEARWVREVPVRAAVPAPHGLREIAGTIDLLLHVPGGVVLIDHKTYPAPDANAVARHAASFLPQLGIYARALEQCGQQVLACCIHFPIAGAWVELQ